MSLHQRRLEENRMIVVIGMERRSGRDSVGRSCPTLSLVLGERNSESPELGSERGA
jgi:hypothetical protein